MKRKIPSDACLKRQDRFYSSYFNRREIFQYRIQLNLKLKEGKEHFLFKNIAVVVRIISTGKRDSLNSVKTKKLLSSGVS